LVNRGILMANGGDLITGMLQHYYSRSMVCGYTAGIGFDFREQNASRVFHSIDAGAWRLRRI
jgi:hypothetical protein